MKNNFFHYYSFDSHWKNFSSHWIAEVLNAKSKSMLYPNSKEQKVYNPYNVALSNSNPKACFYEDWNIFKNKRMMIYNDRIID